MFDEDGPEKKCNRCRDRWPATSEFFYVDRRRIRCPLSSWCRACHIEVKRNRRADLKAGIRRERTNMKVKPATWAQMDQLSSAIELLGHARELLKKAGCPKATEKVRLAISSAEGAQRHMSRRLAATATNYVTSSAKETCDRS